MFKVLTAEEALGMGLTHHGAIYSIPIYVKTVENGQEAELTAKWPPAGYLITALAWLQTRLPGRCSEGFEVCVGSAIKEST